MVFLAENEPNCVYIPLVLYILGSIYPWFYISLVLYILGSIYPYLGVSVQPGLEYAWISSACTRWSSVQPRAGGQETRKGTAELKRLEQKPTDKTGT